MVFDWLISLSRVFLEELWSVYWGSSNFKNEATCAVGWPKKPDISVKNFMTEGKRKLEWRRVRKYIRF